MKTVLLTGFGPFGSITDNPSSTLIKYIDPHLEQKSILSKILSLPVSYSRAPTLIDNVLNYKKFDLILGFGLHRGQDFRLETTAKPYPTSQGKDYDGDTGSVFEPINHHQLYTTLDAEELLNQANQKEPWIRKSTDASGYVCEAIYHRLLSHAVKTDTDCAFIHIPSFNFQPKEKQLELILNLIELALK
ncbi:MAG: hypothetical protein VX185_09790 [Pseudomonadota bacterium]|nr:hypothetical protein [Pseudomonadota bacterium]